MPEQTIVAVVGPTAVGKSALALSLARELDGEIVSADSRQVYRYMDIGTGKPSPRDRAEVPHHLIDISDPDDEYSLALFLRDARSAIRDIFARSRLPIVCGGTGQYVWALLEGWHVPIVAPDSQFRDALYERVRVEGVEALHVELAAVDPAAAHRVDPLNPRRVIRALEVARSAGHPRPEPGREKPPFGAAIVGLTLGKERLNHRIDRRVDSMMAAGWLAEVERLLGCGYDRDLPSMSGLGYTELAQHVRGKIPLEEAVAEIKRRTRKFARRQRGWFRDADERIRWFEGSEEGFDRAGSHIRDALDYRKGKV